MTAVAIPKSGYEKWQDGINKAEADPKWDVYDCDLQLAVVEFNQHLSMTSGYFPLDWQIIKAMIWTETGAEQDLWTSNPMQIGMYNDPGLDDLLAPDKGGAVILPAALRSRLSRQNVTTVAQNSIRAGIGYLLLRMANFTIKSVPDADTKIFDVTVKAGDSFDKIAGLQGSTIEALKKLNPTAHVLHPGQVLKCQKAAMKKVVVGWKPITTANIATYYNGTGDSFYVKKLDYALSLVRKKKAAACSP